MGKRIDKDADITVQSLIRNGGFYYVSKNGDTELVLEEHGDDDFINFGTLKQMKTKNKSILENFKILIIEAEDVTVEEVVSELKLKDSYDELKATLGADDYSFDIDDIEEYVLDSPSETFAKIVSNEKSKVRDLLINEAVYLFKEGRLKDTNKTDAIAKAIGITDGVMISAFWEDIRISVE